MTWRCISFVLGILVCAGVVHAQNDKTEIRAMPLFSPASFTGEQWVPLKIEALNRSNAPIEGQIEIPAVGPSAKATVNVPVTVPPMARVRKSALTWFAGSQGESNAQATEKPILRLEWRSKDRTVLTQSEMFGLPIAIDAYAPRVREGLLLIAGGTKPDTAVEGDAWDFPALAREAVMSDLSAAYVNAEELPRSRAALESVRVIVLQYPDPEQMDEFQRNTLLDFVATGGMLIVESPDVSVADSWLAPYLPVVLVGNREAARPAGLDLLDAVPLSDAIPADQGTIVSQDGSYVHAAYTQHGLGRIIFTSFPVGALATTPNNSAIVSSLLDFAPLYTDWTATALPEVRDSLLTRMIGKAAPKWAMAAGIAGGYALVLLALQFILPGAARPRAFAISAILAVLVTGALMVMAVMRQQTDITMQGSVATLDIAPGGGGLLQENSAFVGPANVPFSVEPADSDVIVRPAAVFGSDLLNLWLPQTGAPQVGLATDRFVQVWYSSRPVSNDKQLGATVRFAEDGVHVKVNNGLGLPLESAAINWGANRLLLNNIAEGSSEISKPASVSAADAIASGAVVTAAEKLQQTMLSAALSNATSRISMRPIDEPVLVGWIDGPLDNAGTLLTPLKGNLDHRREVLVRAPVTIEPTPVGQKVRIPHAAVVMKPDQSATLLYNPYKREWQEVRGPGQFLISFAAPSQVGQVRLEKATIRLNIRAPQHKLTLRTGQIRDGAHKVNGLAPAIAEWSRPVGIQSIDVDIKPTDVDADGRVWILIQAEQEETQMTSMVMPMWKFESVEVDLAGQVTGAPAETSAVAQQKSPTPRERT